MSPNVRAILVLILVFVAGGAAGAALERRYAPPIRVEARRGPATQKEHQIEADQIPFPLEALGLSDDETSQLHAIARRWRPRAAQLVEGLRTDVGDLENGMFAEMLCAISPDKQQRYLEQLQRQGNDTTLINRRFRLVRANECADSLGANPAR